LFEFGVLPCRRGDKADQWEMQSAFDLTHYGRRNTPHEGWRGGVIWKVKNAIQPYSSSFDFENPKGLENQL
jgi:hypothetical protein